MAEQKPLQALEALEALEAALQEIEGLLEDV